MEVSEQNYISKDIRRTDAEFTKVTSDLKSSSCLQRPMFQSIFFQILALTLNECEAVSKVNDENSIARHCVTDPIDGFPLNDCDNATRNDVSVVNDGVSLAQDFVTLTDCENDDDIDQNTENPSMEMELDELMKVYHFQSHKIVTFILIK